MTNAPNPTALLGDYVARKPDDWSAASLRVARDAFADTLACIIAGQGEPVTQRVRAGVSHWGAGRAGVIGAAQAQGLAAPWAALVNGTAAHALDYDDILDPSMSHPSAALVPAILALAEETGDVSGARCLDAWLVGLEVVAALGEAMNLAHYSRGWHTTLSLGAPAVAAACARLMRLGPAEAAHAIGLATSMAGGSKRQFGSMAKPVHAGLAAKNGLMAATLARAGVDASADVFEGRWGLIEMQAGPDARGFAGLADRLSGPPAAERHGVWFKLWPSCGSTHRPVEAALELHRAGGWDLDGIEAIEAWVSPTAIGNLRFVIPETPAEAKFCLPYCVGSALIDGRLDLASFAPHAVGRADVRALTGRFRMSLDPDLANQDLGNAVFERGTLELRLRSGRVLRAECEFPSGHPRNPMAEADLRAKFLDCAAEGGLAPAAAEAAWAEALALPERPAGSAFLPRLPAA